MKNKGFTLIELLAVIVILAVVALIATPIILGIIKDAKEQANKRSLEMYAKAIQNALVNYELKQKRKAQSIDDIADIIEYDGNIVCNTIELYEGGHVYLGECENNGVKLDYTYGQQQKYICKAVEDITTPNKPPYTGYNSGDAYDCEVKEDIWYRFYILSTDGDYVNLIAQQNITKTGVFTKEAASYDTWYGATSENRYGPITAYDYLSDATNDWTNIPIIEDFYYEDEGYKSKDTYGYQSIKTELDKTTGKYITTITPYSSDYGDPKTYENMRTRLPYLKEIDENVVLNSIQKYPLWMVNYLYPTDYYSEEDGKVNSESYNYGYWVLSSYPGYSTRAKCVRFSGMIYYDVTGYARYGIRPVISVKKTEIFTKKQK